MTQTSPIINFEDIVGIYDSIPTGFPVEIAAGIAGAMARTRDDARGLALRWLRRGGVSDGHEVLKLAMAVPFPTIDIWQLMDLAEHYGWKRPARLPKSEHDAGTCADALVAYDRSKSGHIKPTLANICAAFNDPQLCDHHIWYDSFLDMICFGKRGDEQVFELVDEQLTAWRMHFEQCGFSPISSSMMRDCVGMLSRQCVRDSAKEWLLRQVWDGKPRVGLFFSRAMGCEDSRYAEACSLYLWTAMASRIIKPGCQVDMVPVLVGEQGVGKSRSIMAMAPRPSWYREISFSDSDDNIARRMRGAVIGEISELRGLQTRALEYVKAMITRSVENWVPKFKEYAINYHRRIVFIGTTNRQEFLADSTGERRWLPIEVKNVDLQYIEDNRDQLWAEALAIYDSHGLQWSVASELSFDKIAQHKIQDDWAPSVLYWIKNNSFSHKFLTTAAALELAVGVPKDRITKQLSMRMGDVFRELGYTKRRKTRLNGELVWGYYNTND